MAKGQDKPKEKKKYKKPSIKSEPSMSFGSLCNGAVGNGRKASTGSPNFCIPSKLKS